MVSREGIIFLSQSYAARQTDAWRNILDTLSTVPEVITRRPVPQRLPGLPATERLFADIEKPSSPSTVLKTGRISPCAGN